MIYLNKLALVLAKIKQEKGLSNRKLARMAGINEKTVRLFFSKPQTTSWANVQKIAAALGKKQGPWQDFVNKLHD